MNAKLMMSAAILAASVATAAPALAGEITGNDKPTPIGYPTYQAQSLCAFSGLNDDPNEPGAEGKTQEWGHTILANTNEDFTVADAATSGVLQLFGPGSSCRGFASGG